MEAAMSRWVVLFPVIGFLGAAAFYSPYIGINGQIGVECPVCPHVLALWRSPVEAFIMLTLVGGIMNAILFAFLAWLTILSVRMLKRFATH